ncbi:HK97 family phage major capsid protein [Kibdelosporangium banguiense]|uniref:HK97 family phage major capsid protein n=1 Tax=Kibdelosporangium banguiense TaxID=1365924 RepID=A0ABS4TLP3_9PSEU|nr:phage major capsid protein [Kibdelosporangium banguiense]MBP2325333.1 HK97 family phage major capsid protein [Kibdelosporangium banguiense]
MPFPALKEAQDHLAAKQKELYDIFTEAGPDLDMDLIKSMSGTSTDKVAEIRARNDELDELGQKVDDLQTVAKAFARSRQDPERTEPGADTGTTTPTRPGETKSLGQLFTESPAYKGIQGQVGPESHLDIELKALFQTTAGWLPETTRTGTVVPFATRPVQVIDLIPGTSTTQAAVVYMEETVFTNTAAETAEGGTYPEAALQLAEQSSPVRKISVWLPITDDQLEDEPQARGYVNNRLPFMLRQRMDGQILVGSGTAPNLRGFLNTPGTQTQAKGSDPVPDAIYKGMVKVRVTGRALPNAAIIHPLDWQDIRLLRTADGIYIWGSPSEAGPERIWGLGVIQSDAGPENTALVGDFANFSELSTRRGVDVQVSNSHADFFINGKQAVRADVRAALVIYRPAAFCTVTGI